MNLDHDLPVRVYVPKLDGGERWLSGKLKAVYTGEGPVHMEGMDGEKIIVPAKSVLYVIERKD